MRYAGIKRGLLVGLSLGWALSVAAVPLSAEDSDPARWGWMQGSPPPPEKRISFADGSYFQFPQMRWSVAHFRQLMPTVQVARGRGPIQPLASHSCAALDALTFVPWGQSEPMTWAESMRANYTDGIAVLHRGQFPTAEMVIARFGSHPVAANAANDATSLPAYQALATFLLEGGCALPEG